MGVALERGGSSKLEPRQDNKRSICMNTTETIMNEISCNQGRRADVRAATRQVGGAASKTPSHAYHRTSGLGGRAWMKQDNLLGFERINYCTNRFQPAQARNEAAVMKVKHEQGVGLGTVYYTIYEIYEIYVYFSYIRNVRYTTAQRSYISYINVGENNPPNVSRRQEPEPSPIMAWLL